MKINIERIILICCSILCIFISVADFFGFLDQINVLTSISLASITLLLIGLLCLYLIFELPNEKRNIAKGIEYAIANTNGMEIKAFDDKEELFNYIIYRMQTAKRSIDDLSWGNSGDIDNIVKSEGEMRAYIKYLQQKKLCIKRNIVYREVMTFPSLSRYERANDMLSQKRFNYYLKTYIDADDPKPRIVFILIDGEEVIIVSYCSVESTTEYRVSIRHPRIIKIFNEYFNAIWTNPHIQVIKEKDVINTELLALIAEKFHYAENRPHTFNIIGKNSERASE